MVTPKQRLENFPFYTIVNDFCTKNGITLPLQGQSTTNQSNRLEKGIQAQVDIFGQDSVNFIKVEQQI